MQLFNNFFLLSLFKIFPNFQIEVEKLKSVENGSKSGPEKIVNLNLKFSETVKCIFLNFSRHSGKVKKIILLVMKNFQFIVLLNEIYAFLVFFP